MYSFDPVGSYERETYRAGGSAASMLQPLLDNQVQHHHMQKLDTLLYHTTNLKAREEVFSNFYLLWEILLMVWPYVVSTEIRNMYALT